MEIKTIYQCNMPGHSITLQQRGLDEFFVQYGKEVTYCPSYAMAAEQLGLCIMHALACDGFINDIEE